MFSKQIKSEILVGYTDPSGKGFSPISLGMDVPNGGKWLIL